MGFLRNKLSRLLYVLFAFTFFWMYINNLKASFEIKKFLNDKNDSVVQIFTTETNAKKFGCNYHNYKLLKYNKSDFQISESVSALMIGNSKVLKEKRNYLKLCLSGCPLYSDSSKLNEESINMTLKRKYGSGTSINKGIYTGGNVNIKIRLERFHNACLISEELGYIFQSSS